MSASRAKSSGKLELSGPSEKYGYVSIETTLSLES
jgi:hypothetical protein